MTDHIATKITSNAVSPSEIDLVTLACEGVGVAVPDLFRCPDPIQAYRAYYTAEKLSLRNKPVTWTGGDRVRPGWLFAM